MPFPPPRRRVCFPSTAATVAVISSSAPVAVIPPSRPRALTTPRSRPRVVNLRHGSLLISGQGMFSLRIFGCQLENYTFATRVRKSTVLRPVSFVILDPQTHKLVNPLTRYTKVPGHSAFYCTGTFVYCIYWYPDTATVHKCTGTEHRPNKQQLEHFLVVNYTRMSADTTGAADPSRLARAGKQSARSLPAVTDCVTKRRCMPPPSRTQKS